MRNVPGQMWYTWEQGNFLGENRPITRATISKTVLEPYSGGRFRSLLFGSTRADEVEIPNIRTCVVDRRLGTDAAQMTLTVLNAGRVSVDENLDETYLQEAGATQFLEYEGPGGAPTKRELQEFGSPGQYSPRRGVANTGDGSPNPWGHAPDPTWSDMYVPNRVIKTFQGYGTDGASYPWGDTKLVQTGVWLIDRVEMDVNGIITIVCRDLAKLLIEQRLYPPIIPQESYQLNFCSPHQETETVAVPGKSISTTNSEATGPNIADQSTRRYDSSTAYYSISTYGHMTSHAFDGDETTWWASMRNGQPSADWSYEWIDADCHNEIVGRVRFKPWAGGYTCYIGVQVEGAWQGYDTVPYNRYAKPAAPNDSDIKYVQKVIVPPGEDWVTVDLVGAPHKAEYVRLVFTDLQDFSGISGRSDGDYRAGVYEFEVMAHTPEETVVVVEDDTTEEVVTEIPGNITDYTDIIKLFLAWSGFYWPKGRIAADDTVGWLGLDSDPANSDPLFLRDDWGGEGGRAWGDFMDSGAYPVDPPCIPADYWDNKSVMDGINQIKEILGFIGYVDSTGGFVWRPPNIWKTGNFVSGQGYQGETSIPIITEENVLLDFGVTIDDAALRSEIIVVQKDPDPEGTMIWGSFVPDWAGDGYPQTVGGQVGQVSDLSLLAGQVRTMLVADYPFGQGLDDPEKARAEVGKFAYLVALWIHWTYRKTKFRIPGMPALEPDDQVQIFERITSETYIHYLLGVNSVMDMDAGTWYMDIDTHWLGNGPDAEWHVSASSMSPALFAYLVSAGLIEDPADAGPDYVYPDDFWKYVPPTPPKDLPRVADDYEWLFPDLPPWVMPVWDWAGEGPGNDDPDPVPATPTSSGGATGCTNSHAFKFWPGSGPKNVSGTTCYSGYQSRRAFVGANGHYSYAVCDDRAWKAFKALTLIMREEGYEIDYASGYVCRKVKGTNTWSNHAWGLAVDINYPWYGRKRATGSKILAVAARAESIRALDGSGLFSIPVFRWGQHFSNPDPAHWQVCCGPQEIYRGLYIPGYGPFEVTSQGI